MLARLHTRYSDPWPFGGALFALLAAGWLQPAVGMAQAGFNGVLLIRTTSRHMQDTSTQTTKGHKARFDYTCQMAACTVIVDADAHVTMFIRHGQKQYMTMTEADGRQLAALGETAPPEVAARIRQRQLEDGDWSDLKFEKTGKTELVAGVPCETWIGRHPDAGNNDEGQACIGTGKIGLALQLFWSSIVGDSTVERDSGNGLPSEALGSRLLKLVFSKDGGPSTAVEIIRIEPKTVDDSLFARPSGYEEIRAKDVLIHAETALQQLRQRQRQSVSLSPRPGDTLSYPRSVDPRVSQPASLESCDWGSLPPGEFRGNGEVTYRVSAEGIPDTATLTVVRVYGTDAATFRAAAQKVIAVCRFSRLATEAILRQEIRFGGTPRSSDSEILITGDDPDLEKAEMVSCDTKGFTQAGELTLQMVIGVDGYPQPGSIHATSAAFPLLEREAQLILAKCQYKPARYKGVPVRSMILLPFKVRID